MKSTIHLPGLNGIRAIASLGVVLSHTTLALSSFGVETANLGSFANGIDLAGFGVTMFFCLSGFLITYLLLHEREKTGDVAVKQFYVRRALRIWPLYYAFLLVACAYLYYKNGRLDNVNSLPFYILLCANIPFIMNKIISVIGHYWSLGVEEQFYLFWPWLGKIPRHRLLVFSTVIVIVGIFAKLIIRIYVPDFDSSLIYRIVHVTRFHCMALGAVASILYYERNELFLKISQHWVVQTLVFASIILMLINKFHFASFLDNEIVGVLTIALIIGQLDVDKRLVNLNGKLFNFLGKISYGIYVIHPLIIFILSSLVIKLHFSSIVSGILAYISVLVSSVIVAYISYNYLEKPFLRIKTRYMVVPSSASAT